MLLQQINENLQQLEKDRKELSEQREMILDKLSQASSLSLDQAKTQLLDALDEQLVHEKGTLVRRALEESKLNSEQNARKILVQAMQRFAGDCTYERTTSTVPLPSDDMKGRIIGREGRNIRVFEAATGVNVLIDDTPSAVVISSFDPVRREVARIALERLVDDGRIHPTRVE